MSYIKFLNYLFLKDSSIGSHLCCVTRSKHLQVCVIKWRISEDKKIINDEGNKTQKDIRDIHIKTVFIFME